MKITKFVHACLLVEMPAPVNRTALFDPGSMSEEALDVGKLEYLDDIFITHIHGDHVSLPLMRKLVAKFPEVRITAPPEVVAMLQQEGITASAQAPAGASFFDSPHEDVRPLFPVPQEIGIHYLDRLSVPGDSHGFRETMPILALPVDAPWGSMIRAIKLALELKPQHVVPVHDWFWHDAARASAYSQLEEQLAKEGITFHKLETGVPVVLDV